MALSLKDPETQAKVSSWLVAAGLVLLLLAVVAAFLQFQWDQRMFVYSLKKGARAMFVFGAVFVSLCMGAGAFWFSFRSAGERRNSLSRLSWISFAASAVLIVVGCVFMAAFYFLRVPEG